MSSGGRGMFRKAIALAMVAGGRCAGPGGPFADEAGSRPVVSAPAVAQPCDGLPTASRESLAAQRGGLRAGGLDLAFTANVRTLVNGTLVLESVTNLTPGVTTVTQSNMPTTGVDPTTLSFVGGRGGAQSNAIPAGLAGLAGQRGVVVEDPTGLPTPRTE